MRLNPGVLSMSVMLAAASVVPPLSDAVAGGFSRGTADTDILYEDGNFNIRAGAVVVAPTQKFTSATNPALLGTDYLETYIIPSTAVKLKFSDQFSCAGTFIQAYGAKSAYASFYGPTGKVSEAFTVSELGATCAAFFNAGRGRISVLGGVFVELFDYAAVSGFGTANLALGSNAVGWRAGLGYEIPEMAFRAQILYRSETSHEATGTFNGLPIAAASGVLPQSVEVKVRSGIAPGWLAFGSVKWTDWSSNQTLTVFAGGAPLPPNQYFWKDGWTVTGGIGHAFSDTVSGSVIVQWDGGVSTGFDYRTDKWLVGADLGVKDALGGELRLGAAVSVLTSASITKGIDAGHSVGSGWAGILTANYKVRW